MAYGKIFESLFAGSMVGAGAHVFAVWSYVIACHKAGAVDLNPVLLAAIIGEPKDVIESAIVFLCSPDPNSRSKEQDGRRLIQIGPIQYRVVNWAHYKRLMSDEQRREYMRDYMREMRNPLDTNNVNTCKQVLAKLTQTETETETETEIAVGKAFNEFWEQYPRKVGKAKAFKAFGKARCHRLLPKILEAIGLQKQTPQWSKDSGQFIPHPTKWINEGRWNDEVQRHTPKLF